MLWRFFNIYLFILMKSKVFSKFYWFDFVILFIYLLVGIIWKSIKIILSVKEVYIMVYIVSLKE